MMFDIQILKKHYYIVNTILSVIISGDIIM
jgi:hypothetical protein